MASAVCEPGKGLLSEDSDSIVMSSLTYVMQKEMNESIAWLVQISTKKLYDVALFMSACMHSIALFIWAYEEGIMLQQNVVLQGT